MTLLVLAGTAEARELVETLVAEGRPVIASLAGATRSPRALPAPTWTGGFGGVARMADRLRDARIAAVADATHPFAARISAAAAQVCAQLDLPRLALVRPEWTEPAPGAWRRFATMDAAVEALPPGARVLAATGAGGLPALARRPDLRIVARTAEAPEAPPPGLRLIVGRPPFGEAQDRALMRREGITHLLARNSGGRADGKLAAAHALGVRVFMIDRPPPPPGPHAPDAAAAADWARRQLDAAAR